MPASISIVPGFIVEHNGKPSSHFDAILTDNSYPFLASIGPHRFVMVSSVVAAIELTTKLDKKKLISVLKKSAEVARISKKLYGPGSPNSGIGFYALGVDSEIANVTLRQEFTQKKPEGHLFVLRGGQGKPGYHCWMNGLTFEERVPAFRETTSPLADFVSMHLQDNLYALSARVRDAQTVGETMNYHIYWGTIGKRGK